MPQATTFFLKQGNTLPIITATLTDQYGSAVNLTGAAVHFHMTNFYFGNVVNSPATIVNATAGQVSYAWQTGDTNSTGLFSCEWYVVFASGAQETYPYGYYDYVQIDPSLSSGFPEVLQPTAYFNTISSSASAPTALNGNNGDFWYDITTGYFYGPKANGTWPSGFSLQAVYPLAINQGGTGSTTQNFVDTSTNQTVAGNKSFSGTVSVSGPLLAAGVTDWINVTDSAYGATGNGLTDDTTAINAALAAAYAQGGGTVYLPWGDYLTSGPLQLPPGVTLQGETRITTAFIPGTVPAMSRIVVSGSWAPSALTGAIQIRSLTAGSWTTQNLYSGVRGVMIDCSLNSSIYLNGIFFVGPVYDTHLEDVLIYKAPHDGVSAGSQSETGIGPTYPYHQRWRRVTAYYCGFRGFNLINLTDSVYQDCMAFGNVDNGWYMTNSGNSLLLGCKSEWNGASGFMCTGTGTGLSFTGCETDQNTNRGIYLNAVTDTDGGGISITGGKLHADGHDGTSAGIDIVSCTVPITVTGISVQAGAYSATTAPVFGAKVTGSSAVSFTGCVLGGLTKGLNNGGTNTLLTMSNNIEYIGAVGSAVATPTELYLVKPSDQTTTSNTTLTNDVDLVTPVLPPSSTWEVSCCLVYDGSTTSDIKLGWTHPASSTFVFRGEGAGTGASTSPVSMGGAIFSVTSNPAFGGVGVGTEIPAVMQGILTVTTAGVLQLQWCQNTTDATVLTVRAGSYLKLRRIS